MLGSFREGAESIRLHTCSDGTPEDSRPHAEITEISGPKSVFGLQQARQHRKKASAHTKRAKRQPMRDVDGRIEALRHPGVRQQTQSRAR